MKIVINSHIKSNVALQHLMESLKEIDNKEYEIIVVIGGYYDLIDYEISKDENITYIRANHNSIDFTGLIALLELYSENVNEYYMYLHDTCKVGNNFYKLLKSIDLTNVSSMKINKKFSMNIGIYSQKIINHNKKFLLGKKNKDENRCMEFKSVNNGEDHIFNTDPNKKVLNDYDGWIKTGPTDYYKTGTMRIVEYYPHLDLYKIKANWGQEKMVWTLNV